MNDDQALLDAVERVLLPQGTELPSLEEPERVFVRVWQLEVEVQNGGLDQYYFNSAGDHAVQAPAALRAIGADRTALIVERANALFPSSAPPADRGARQALLLDHVPDDAFDEPTDAFDASPDALVVLLAAYVRAHAADIRGAQ